MGTQFPSVQRIKYFQIKGYCMYFLTIYSLYMIKQKPTKIISYLFFTQGKNKTWTQYEMEFPERTTSENNNLWGSNSPQSHAVRSETGTS